ncbi:hypothetical protein IT779_31605 [Nocardia sp. NEAU-351]|uniref:Uncharacterized protein n=1 Tax=Nocardia bovistercoris TaxID=2785916 RepID=A0A931IIW6_9NOCA|nr:hypothetical protein [Nocardia bovistercoris]
METARARARAVADAVLYEGYLLYPYRANARKNQTRWQFGVLGPPGSAAAGLGEDPELRAQCLLDATEASGLALTVRFLQLQRRRLEDTNGDPCAELVVNGRTWIGWDEAVEREVTVGPMPLAAGVFTLSIPGGTDTEELLEPDGAHAGRVLRTRLPLTGELEVRVEPAPGARKMSIMVRNTGTAATDKDDAIARSFIGAHVLAEVAAGQFISLIDPPDEAMAAVAGCTQDRCFPVLAGPPGEYRLMLISPIILYDHPEIAEQSEMALYDSTEIDEILTLRVITMTDEEKVVARATDPRAARIIDACDALDPDTLGRLHGVLRDPHRGDPGVLPEVPIGTDWWDPDADAAVRPESDAVAVGGTLVRRGSRVRLRPARRADAHDLFYDGRTARVVTVHQDVDGATHIGVVVEDDPAAELHEWYGRYLYFAPEEIEPLDGAREER